MFYYTELHCHTSEVSINAAANLKETVDLYIENGYTTVVLTNHLSDQAQYYGEGNGKHIDNFIDCYKKMKEYAGDRLNIILGAEVRLNGRIRNDYLIYGITEDFLRRETGLLDMEIKQFSALCRENGFLVIQAHPMRVNMTVTDPRYLDGIEVYNGGIYNDSHNDLADKLANYHDYIKTSGSDQHFPDAPPTGGIATNAPITTREELVSVLRSREYFLLKSEKPGMTRPM